MYTSGCRSSAWHRNVVPEGGAPQPTAPCRRMSSTVARGAYRSLMAAYETPGAMISGCRLTTLVEPQGIRLGRPPSAQVVIIPTEEGKKQGQRDRSLSSST